MRKVRNLKGWMNEPTPPRIHCDNGREFNSRKIKAAIKSLRRPKNWAKLGHALEVAVVVLGTKLPLGRPLITMAVDAGSKTIVGMHVGMSHSESYLGLQAKIINRCLRHANTPQRHLPWAYPESDHIWDAHGVPETPAVDDSKEEYK